MAKKGLYGVNTYRERSKKKIGRHKKNLNKSQKPYKKYRGQGRQGVDKYPILTYIYRMKGKNKMQETITKYQSKFDRLMTSIEKDKILKKMPGNATAGIAVQMIKSLKSYLKANKA